MLGGHLLLHRLWKTGVKWWSSLSLQRSCLCCGSGVVFSRQAGAVWSVCAGHGSQLCKGTATTDACEQACDTDPWLSAG